MHEVVHATKSSGLPAPVFIHRATVETADSFFESRFKSARAISDTDGILFDAFGLRRGTLVELVGPRAIWRAICSMFKGHFVGKPTGNETQMPGAFLVHQREILWEHRARHAGHQPDLDTAIRTLKSRLSAHASSGHGA